ncbi:unnamed protein product [Clonostachys rosea]|uniref:Uncharacterized protein n=1 Tax=Bionectria ochroleuca TaxID=29856 RepID=A0ABY6UBT0_BIOOC|nr:unnamed protein product [Clonostachys rosea]
MALPLAGKHCAIVGATGIIGTSIAKAFASHGAVLTLLSRSILDAQPSFEKELRKPQTSTADKPPAIHRYIKLDVCQPDNVAATFRGLQNKDQAVGPVDILINCAGISQTTLLKRTPDEEIRSVLDTNLLATMLACKHAKVQPNGCIINISSLMATKGAIGATVYAASKAGVVGSYEPAKQGTANANYLAQGFTRALCLEMSARSIRVNALLPGWVESPMWNNLKPDLKKEYLQATPLKRIASPDEVADAAVFLATNQFANNCVLNLDGGLSAS